MAGSRKRLSKTSGSRTSAGTRSATVKGAVPYKPKMTRAEAVKEIERVSGKAVSMRELREELPVARIVRKGSSSKPRAARAGRAAAARAGAPAEVSTGLTNDERLTLIDQAMLMLQEVYAHLPLKRALHAIDPIQ